MIDPGSAYLIGQGVNAFGGLLSGGEKGKDRHEQAREFNIEERYRQEQGRNRDAFSQVDQLNGMQRQLDLLPMRDKVAYMLNARMGMVPQNFQGRDMANPMSAPQAGGIDPAALQQTANAYQAPTANGAGSGGMDPRIYQTLMAKLGLTNGPGGPQLTDPNIRPGSILPSQGPGPIVGPGGVTNPDSMDTSGRGPNGRAIDAQQAAAEAAEQARRQALLPPTPNGMPSGGGWNDPRQTGGGQGRSPWQAMNMSGAVPPRRY